MKHGDEENFFYEGQCRKGQLSKVFFPFAMLNNQMSPNIPTNWIKNPTEQNRTSILG